MATLFEIDDGHVFERDFNHGIEGRDYNDSHKEMHLRLDGRVWMIEATDVGSLAPELSWADRMLDVTETLCDRFSGENYYLDHGLACQEILDRIKE